LGQVPIQFIMKRALSPNSVSGRSFIGRGAAKYPLRTDQREL